MTETQQHQEPIKHAEEHAEAAITAALQADDLLQFAQLQADPKLILSSQARLKKVQHEIKEAQDQLHEVNASHKYDAQLVQVNEGLHQAQEDIEIAMDDSHMPKQVR
jgi:hypothetical protein